MEGNTQEKIEKVAYEEFLRKGYESTNLRTISNMVGIKAASIYFYYKSKSELFLKIYDSICEKYNNIIETILSKSEKDNPAKVLYQLVLARMQDCMNNSLPFQFLFRYYLFPVEDLQDDILCIQKKWEEREFQLNRPVISTCMSTIS
ncbi:MAG: hypothetical protein PWP24_1852 [Clostridiales bacterium]|nr:hypothetical protein [Clostridiales bacterium]